MLFIVGLPVVQILLFCYAIGHDPTGLKLAVANHEMSEEMIMQQFCPVHAGCNQTMLSCRYLDMLVKNKSMVVVSICNANYLKVGADVRLLGGVGGKGGRTIGFSGRG